MKNRPPERPQWAVDRLQATDLDLALGDLGIGVWAWDPESGAMLCNPRMKEICGISQDAPSTFDTFLNNVRAEDRDCTREALLKTVRDGASRTIEYRVADHNSPCDRWIAIEGRAYARDHSMHVVGTAREISPSNDDANRALALRDIEHKVKHTFSLMAAYVALSARSANLPAQLVRALETHIESLAPAYGLQPIASASPADLRDVIVSELAPYTDTSTVTIDGPEIPLGPVQAVAMNVIFHELVDNAARYGALSSPEGELSIRWYTKCATSADCLVLYWREECHRKIQPPTARGFGFRLLSFGASMNLRGDISIEFRGTGLVATLAAPLAHLSAGAERNRP